MTRLPAVLALSLLLAALPARAAEVPPPQFIAVFVAYEGMADGNVITHQRIAKPPISVDGTDAYHWAYNWSVVAELNLTGDPGVYEGEGLGNFSGVASRSGEGTWQDEYGRIDSDSRCTTRYEEKAWPVSP